MTSLKTLQAFKNGICQACKEFLSAKELITLNFLIEHCARVQKGVVRPEEIVNRHELLLDAASVRRLASGEAFSMLFDLENLASDLVGMTLAEDLGERDPATHYPVVTVYADRYQALLRRRMRHELFETVQRATIEEADRLGALLRPVLLQLQQVMTDGGVLELRGRAHLAPADMSPSLSTILLAIEFSGFAGVRILSLRKENSALAFTIQARKLSQLFDSHKALSVRYRGPMVAGVDDLGDFLFAGRDVRIPFSSVYTSIYGPSVSVRVCAPNAHSIRIAQTGFEEDETIVKSIESLVESLPDARGSSAPERILLYAGPLRAVIARDGTVFLRGVPNVVSQEMASFLHRETQDFIDAANFHLDHKEDAPVAPLLWEATEQFGPSFLFASKNPDAATIFSRNPVSIGLTPSMRNAIEHASAPLLFRLEQLLKTKEKYFVLHGSDPADPHGCCPSDLVGAANALVRANILASQALAVTSSPQACPMTIYALSGELNLAGARLEHRFNEALREQVRIYLGL